MTQLQIKDVKHLQAERNILNGCEVRCGRKQIDNQRLWRHQLKGHGGNLQRCSHWAADGRFTRFPISRALGSSKKKSWKQDPGQADLAPTV